MIINRLPNVTFELWANSVTYLAKKLSVWADIQTERHVQPFEFLSQLDRQRFDNIQFPETKINQDLTIAPDLLNAFIEDIHKAEEKFRNVIKEGNCFAMHNEFKKARKSVCVHLGKIKELNEGLLPYGELDKIWISYKCPEKLDLRTELKDFISDSFSDGELQEVCFNLGIDYEGISGKNKNEKVISLITYYERRQELVILTNMVKKLRPNFE